MPRSSAVALTAAAWGFGSAITCLIVGSPFLLFGYHEPSLHLVLNSVDACVALLVAYLLLGAFLRSRRLQDELLAQGFLLLALAGVVGMVLPQFVPAFSAPTTLEVWLPLTLRVAGAFLVVTAALVGGRTASRHRNWWLQPVPWVLAVLMMLLVARDWLPVALSQSVPSSAGQPVICWPRRGCRPSASSSRPWCTPSRRGAGPASWCAGSGRRAPSPGSRG
jgi:hypothetical protein